MFEELYWMQLLDAAGSSKNLLDALYWMQLKVRRTYWMQLLDAVREFEELYWMQLLDAARKFEELYWMQLLDAAMKFEELYWMQLLPVAITSSSFEDSTGSTYWKFLVSSKNYWKFCREMVNPVCGSWVQLG